MSYPTNFSQLAERLNQLTMEVRNLESEIRTVRRALYSVALTVTGSAVLFAITIFAH